MKRICVLSFVFAICWFITSSATAQHVAFKLRQPDLAPPAAPLNSANDSAMKKEAPTPTSEKPADKAPDQMPEMPSDGDQSSCCSEASCGCESGCCDSCGCGCDCSLCIDHMWPFCCCCDLGDPCTLQSQLTPCCNDVTYGGWVEIGYHSDFTGLSHSQGDGLDTNDVPFDVRGQQIWGWIEKKAKTDSCCWDWGYRFDAVYGTDGKLTQAFGNSGAPNAQGWDNDFDHGIYGWALPQAYVELGYNDWSIKVGHLQTPMGYEVFPAPGNFFYSHSLEWFNSEPLTHTGVLGTYTASECMTYYVGWTLGWDTGFDQYRDGSNFLGGFTRKLNDNVSFTYITCTGDLGFRSGNEFGYSHTITANWTLSEKWNYILQNDYIHTDGFLGDGNQPETDFGLANYLLYTINDCWKAGFRGEWWKSNGVVLDDSISFYEITGGLNYKPHANVTVRPEIRYQWTPAEDAVGFDFNHEIAACDIIITF